MKKIVSIVLTLTLALSLVAIFASCSSENSGDTTSTATAGNTASTENTEGTTTTATADNTPWKPEDVKQNAIIAIPNDPTNEARALLLLENLGLIEIDGTKGLSATINDITSNPKNIEFFEIDAAQVALKLPDVDYAVINTNYALDADLNPQVDAVAVEGSASAYGNILSVKKGNENTPKTLALKAALESKQIADFINTKYNGAVLSVVDKTGNGFDAGVDYNALKGTTIKVIATPVPHAEILEEAKKILAEKEITLEIETVTDYNTPNQVVDSGEYDANYFQHTPYMDEFNEQKGTQIVSVAKIHVEPMGLYVGTKSDK